MSDAPPTTHVAITVDAFRKLEKVAMKVPGRYCVRILEALAGHSPLSHLPSPAKPAPKAKDV
jgi:hypothetical protein